MDLDQVKDYIQHYGLYLQLIAVIAYVVKFRTADTFLYMCIGILVLTPLHVVYQKELLELAKHEEYRGLVRNLWYFGFAVSDVLLVLSVTAIARREKLKFDYPTILLAGCFLLLAFIQIAGYFDQVITELNALADFYMAIIPLINIFITIVIVSCVAAAVLFKRSS